MRPRVFHLLICSLVAAAAAAIGRTWGWHEHRPGDESAFFQRRLALLDADNARLAGLIADRQRTDLLAADRARRPEIEETVSRLRNLAFLHPVAYEEIPRSQLPAVLRQKLAQQVPDQEFGDTSVSLAALGLLPAGLDLKKTYLDLLGEQVGAFYDQHTGELVTFSGQSLDNAQNRIILAHELTHALEDQHFHLARLPLETKGNDDRALAASALVEGDATLVMSRYTLGDLSAATIRDTVAGSLNADLRQIASAPRFLRETLLFPYLRGQEFCQAIYQAGGWEALARAFEHPPGSTAEILHPERFLAPADGSPASVELPGSPVLGQAPIGNNVLGEFGVRQLLVRWLRDEAGAARVAAGWRADRYLVYGDSRATSYVWKIAWSSPASAAEFADAAERCWRERFHLQADAFRAEVATAARVASLPSGHRLSVRVLGESVVLIDAQDLRWENALRGLPGAGVTPSSPHDGGPH